jgi:hypothetical protein
MSQSLFSKKQADAPVHHPFLTSSGSAVTDRSLALARKRVESKSLLQRLLMPVDEQRIASELNAIQAEASKNIAIRQIHALADLRGQQIELDCEREQAAIRNAQTNIVGDLTRYASIKMAEAMSAYVKAEQTWQSNIAHSDCSHEDQQFLSSLAKGLAHMRTCEIAKQHGFALPSTHDSHH